MSGTTSPLGLPYPTGSDPVIAACSAIPQALAEAVDDLLAGAGPTALLAGTSMTLNGTRAHRRGQVGILNAENLTATANRALGSVVCTLSPGYRPSTATRGVLVVYTAGTSTPILVEIQTNGEVVIANAITSGQALYGSVVYPL